MATTEPQGGERPRHAEAAESPRLGVSAAGKRASASAFVDSPSLSTVVFCLLSCRLFLQYSFLFFFFLFALLLIPATGRLSFTWLLLWQANMSTRAPYVVPALKKHTATVIMAHGLGDRFVFFLSHPFLIC